MRAAGPTWGMFSQMDRGRAVCVTALIPYRLVSIRKIPGRNNRYALRLYDFAGFNAAGAYADPFGPAIYFGLNGTKIYVPAALGHVVRVRDFVAELRTLAADFTNLSHDKLQIAELFAETRTFSIAGVGVRDKFRPALTPQLLCEHPTHISRFLRDVGGMLIVSRVPRLEICCVSSLVL